MSDSAASKAQVPKRTRPKPAAGKSIGLSVPDSLLKTLAESMREYAVAVTADRTISYWNTAFQRKFGAPKKGSKLEEYFDPPALRALIKTAINGDSPREADVVSDQGGPQGAVYHVIAVPIKGGEPQLLLIVDDVSEQADQRNRMIANSRLVAVGEMAAGVAHELNNPLTAVLGFSQLAVRQTDDPTLKRDLDSIAHEAERAGHIVDNLLGFARAHSGLGDYFDPTASLQKILDLREYECRVNNIEVVTYFDSDTPRTRADAHRMEQVFLNLLGNAIQAIAEGPGQGTVTVGLVAIDGLIRISFTDNGPGIPQEVIEHIFEPFYTTKPVGKGTGLGLSICQEIVRDHGGEIRVESHARRGTTFVVEIPIVPIAEPQEIHTEEPATPQSFSMLKVLAVDDEPVITDLLSRVLTGLGHEVDTASDGAEAIRRINLSNYDAIILDVKMPGLGGPEVLRCIEGLKPDLAKRVLFITGDTVSPNTQAFFESEGHEALHKPFSLEELRKRLQPFAVAKDLRTNAGPVRKRPDLTAGISRISRKL